MKIGIRTKKILIIAPVLFYDSVAASERQIETYSKNNSPHKLDRNTKRHCDKIVFIYFPFL